MGLTLPQPRMISTRHRNIGGGEQLRAPSMAALQCNMIGLCARSRICADKADFIASYQVDGESP
jgi:hypothetical protein